MLQGPIFSRAPEMKRDTEHKAAAWLIDLDDEDDDEQGPARYTCCEWVMPLKIVNDIKATGNCLMNTVRIENEKIQFKTYW